MTSRPSSVVPVFDPAFEPDLFESVLSRRTVAYLFDVLGVSMLWLLAAVVVFFLGLATFGFAWMIYPALWPIIGVMIGPLVGENLRWRKNPLRRRMYIKATWLWVGLFAARLIVQYPLYKSGNITALGTARLIMGYPLFIATAWATWLVIKSAPRSSS